MKYNIELINLSKNKLGKITINEIYQSFHAHSWDFTVNEIPRIFRKYISMQFQYSNQRFPKSFLLKLAKDHSELIYIDGFTGDSNRNLLNLKLYEI